MTDRDRIQTVRDHLRHELGEMGGEQREQVVAVLRVFMTRLNVLLMQAGGRDACCVTCPLIEKSHEWDGFATTAYGILKSCRDGTPFVCHIEQPGHDERFIDIYNLKWCGGFRSVMNTNKEDVHNLVAHTLVAIRLIVPVRTLARISMAGKNAN